MSAFDFVSHLDADWKSAVAQFRWFRVDRFVLHPERWRHYDTASGATMTWQSTRFDPAGVKQLPDDQNGIYIFYR
jgi:hypothetical protein